MSGKTKRLVVLLCVLLFAAGLAVMLYPYIRGACMDRAAQITAEEFLSREEIFDREGEDGTVSDSLEETAPVHQREHSELWAEMSAYNEDIHENGQSGLVNMQAYMQPSFILTDYGLEDEVFGVISIPALDLNMPIYLGASKQNMAVGAAIMSQTSLPIGGNNTNCVICGHRGWNGAAYFLHLDQLKIGDTVTITNLWEELRYEVVETQIISPYDMDAVKIQEDRELITLLTCHPPASGGKQRLLVICERVYDLEDYG